MLRDVYIVDGARTPFIKASGKPNNLSSADLAVTCAKQLLARQSFSASDLDEVIVGCVIPAVDEANIARVISLRAGCGDAVTAWTVQRNCASGLQAIDSAVNNISSGKSDLVLAGGTEAMSRAPLMFPLSMSEWLTTLNSSKTIIAKLKCLAKLRIKHFKPVIALLEGLTDPVTKLNMGQTAEKLAHQFSITREDMDEFAVRSHRLASTAIKNKVFEEIIPLFDWSGNYFDVDNGVRLDSNVQKLAKLKPVFDRPFGTITAANSSQITDGSALLLLASKSAVDKYNLTPVAKIQDIVWSGLDPSIMGLGPAYSIAKLLKNNNLTLEDIACWEINEAFAAQVIACVRALDDEQFCKQELGLPSKLGKINLDTVNIHGGAIAIGHPVGASGARLVLHLANILKDKNFERGVASLCIGGGQGGAILIEKVRSC